LETKNQREDSWGARAYSGGKPPKTDKGERSSSGKAFGRAGDKGEATDTLTESYERKTLTSIKGGAAYTGALADGER